MGNRQTDIRSGVLKQRLKPDGTAVGQVLKNATWSTGGSWWFCLVLGGTPWYPSSLVVDLVVDV